MAKNIVKHNVPDDIYVESRVVEADSTPVTSPSISSIYSDYLFKKKSKKERKMKKNEGKKGNTKNKNSKDFAEHISRCNLFQP